ncbi:MAG: NAD(P)-dependent glycerol-3-phosphate dehydrogenase [Lautropia sp.]|nr:MAG: NAD(P)-dependent glycerol-3-phosphate dehydrogenase [Pseudomonadota bacterium]MBC6960723.1 NAD(P)-dependent glycerol-3-phosphate dehydrogenase [Lautropia sp.]MCL4700681.1 NAD(P)-dependent glycerol-3-phosphate dehydrogenase [Burkholderiaceae bacterium]MDL1908581.1 NAD(P)-dependent glycerol-3-phosphate dehydrogenase [Betaproteobacteria bacterium PRO1]RIK88016.1 MAG: glycerol-3-phosphate dehydrogenase [Burkholderiales bacterium]
MRIAIFGAGAWGTALAVHAAKRHPVMLWARDRQLVEALREARCNERYLPGVALAPQIEFTDDAVAACRWLDAAGSLAVVATPVAGLRPTLRVLDAALAAATRGVVWLCKGIEAATGRLPHELAAEELHRHDAAVLSGPSFAQEVAAGLPVALTVASASADLQAAAVEAFHHGPARIYRSDDVIGVELGGALKNVMAIAAGICDGLSLGQNARAALITRGLAETVRLGTAMGARAETFMGLTGLGDLVLTCTGDLSRNRQVGLALAAGESLETIVAQLGHVAEGVHCAQAAEALARTHGVEMPIVSAVNAVLAGRQRAREAVLALLSREPRNENDRTA